MKIKRIQSKRNFTLNYNYTPVKYGRTHGAKKLTIYVNDMETFMDTGKYFKQHGDTACYLLGSIKCNIQYNIPNRHYEVESKETEEQERARFKVFALTYDHIRPDDKKKIKKNVIQQYISYYTTLVTVRRHKLGYHQVHYFHNGGKFDMWFTIYDIVKDMSKVVWLSEPVGKAKDLDYDVYYCNLLHSSVFRKFVLVKKVDDNKIITMEFRDSYYLFNHPIKTLGANLDPKIEKGDTIDSLKKIEARGYVDKVLDKEAYKYLFYDVIIMKRTFENYVEFLPYGTKIPETASSWTLQNFLHYKKEKNQDPKIKNSKIILRKEIEITEEERQEINDYFLNQRLYRGGFTTLNSDKKHQILKNVGVEDVVSQYPHKMVKNVPCGPRFRITDKDHYEQVKKTYEFIYVELEYKNIRKKDKTILDILDHNYIRDKKPKKLPDQQYQPYAETYSLYATINEHKWLQKLYNFESAKFVQGIFFKKGKPIFKEYIEHWYVQKSLGKEEGNLILEKFAKIVLNGLYGKLGEKNVKEVQVRREHIATNKRIITTPDAQYTTNMSNRLGLANIEEEANVETSYLQIAAWITGESRAYLLERSYEAFKLGLCVVYCDTDSLFINNSFEECKKLTHGSKLGDWEMKPKDFFYYGVILGAKKYFLFNERKDTFKQNHKKANGGISTVRLENYTPTHWIMNKKIKVLKSIHYPSGIILTDTFKQCFEEKTFNQYNYSLKLNKVKEFIQWK